MLLRLPKPFERGLGWVSMSATRVMAWHRASVLPVPSAAPMDPESRPWRLGTVLAVVGAGLFMQGVGDALARTGHQGPVLPLFLVGLVVIFAPCAWRLTSAQPGRTERIWISVVLGLGLLASYVLRSPLIFDGFDELAHGATLIRLLDGRSLLPTNTVLPVSPYYPGLEMVTYCHQVDHRAAVGSRPADRPRRSSPRARVVRLPRGGTRLWVRAAGGIGVLAYAANPHFAFDTQYAYETLALAFRGCRRLPPLRCTDPDHKVPTQESGNLGPCARGHRGGRRHPPHHRMAHDRVPVDVGDGSVYHRSPASIAP